MDNHKLHESSEGLSLISQFGSLGLCLRKPVLGSLDSFDENLSDKNPASLSCAPSLHPPLRKIEDFVELLQSTRLSGPVLFTDKRTLIGKGSQFAVFKCKMAGGALIAIKQPLFFLEPDRELNLADSKVSQQIHDMYLEVLALCHPTLRTHPNIVRLQAWGRDDFIWHEPPVLVLELAASDLKIFMSETEDCLLKKGEDIALWKLKHRLCLDIAAGLDAIHECQLIHGDLKPENILIFEQDDGVIAKLADFGLSLDEAVCDPSFAISGTPGWRAPEVEEGSVKATELPQADNYTYGLVAWSILLLKGDTPPKSQNIDRANLLTEMLKESSSRIPTLLRNLVPKRLLQVMELKPSLRPLRVAESLSTNDGNHDKW